MASLETSAEKVRASSPEIDGSEPKSSNFPYKAVVAISFICFSNAYSTCYIFSFVGFMVVDFGEAKTKDEAGYYAGYIASAFMLGRVLSAVAWGYFADKYGRKPAILIGGLSIAVFSLCFGLVDSLVGAILIRLVAGITNGIIATSKTIGSEINGGEHNVYIMSVVIGSWSLGLILGPSISGLLSKPAELYPSIFPKDSIWDTKPYLLTSLLPTGIGVVSMLLCYFWLPETLKTSEGSAYKVVATAEDDVEKADSKPFTPENTSLELEIVSDENEKNLKHFHYSNEFLLVTTLYCALSFVQIMIDEVIPLWALSSEDKGGLEMSLPEIGTLIAFGGWLMLIYQFILYTKVVEYFKLTATFWISCLGVSFILFLEPFIVSTTYKLKGDLWRWTLFAANGSRIALQSGAFTAISILSNNAVEQKFRGRANGVVMMAASIFKMLGPTIGSVLYAISINSQVLNFYFVFWISGTSAFLLGIIARKTLPVSLNAQNQQ